MFTITKNSVGGLVILRGVSPCYEFEEEELPKIIEALQKYLDKKDKMKVLVERLEDLLASVESGELLLQDFERFSPTQEAPFIGDNTVYVPTGDIYIKMHFKEKRI